MKYQESKFAKQQRGPSAGTREELAHKLPFALRAWWLHEYEESSDLSFESLTGQTRPLYCLHSDPLCDAGNMDFGAF